MNYYPIKKRFGDELHDIREFITKDSLSVKAVVETLKVADRENFIEDSWNWVVKNVKYPYFNKSIAQYADRHYIENYISPSNSSKVLRNALISGTVSGVARKVFTGTIAGGVTTLLKDAFIANGLYSLVMAMVDNNNRGVKPQFQYEQYDFWNFPAETLRDMTGDCEDTSNLLCSILRSELSQDEVFVTVGTFEGYGHAWVTVYNRQGIPLVLETTGENVVSVDESIIEELPYVPYLRFNDKRVIVLKNDVDLTTRKNAKQEEFKKITSLINFYVLKNTFFEY